MASKKNTTAKTTRTTKTEKKAPTSTRSDRDREKQAQFEEELQNKVLEAFQNGQPFGWKLANTWRPDWCDPTVYPYRQKNGQLEPIKSAGLFCLDPGIYFTFGEAKRVKKPVRGGEHARGWYSWRYPNDRHAPDAIQDDITADWHDFHIEDPIEGDTFETIRAIYIWHEIDGAKGYKARGWYIRNFKYAKHPVFSLDQLNGETVETAKAEYQHLHEETRAKYVNFAEDNGERPAAKIPEISAFIDRAIKALGAEIVEGNFQTGTTHLWFSLRDADHKKLTLTLPMPEQFTSAGDYYEVIFHELGHATGWALKRKCYLAADKFGKPNYCQEELVAEQISAYMLAYFGLETPETLKRAGDYLRNWSSTLVKSEKITKRAKQACLVAWNQAIKGAQWLIKNGGGDLVDFGAISQAQGEGGNNIPLPPSQGTEETADNTPAAPDTVEGLADIEAEAVADGIAEKLLGQLADKPAPVVVDPRTAAVDKSLAENVYSWYRNNYPLDDMGEDIRQDITFRDLCRFIPAPEPEEFYSQTFENNGGDSLVRERLFDALATRLQLNYEVIYDSWLARDGSDIYDAFLKELAESDRERAAEVAKRAAEAA